MVDFGLSETNCKLQVKRFEKCDSEKRKQELFENHLHKQIIHMQVYARAGLLKNLDKLIPPFAW